MARRRARKSSSLGSFSGLYYSMVAGQGKLGALRRKAFREGFLLGLIVLLLGSISYGIDYYNASNVQEQSVVNGQIAQLASEMQQLEQRIFKGEQALPVYEALFAQNKKGEILLDRERAQEVLEKLKEDYMFQTMRLTMSPIGVQNAPPYGNEWAKGQICEFEISLEAISDVHVIQFLDRIQDELKGLFKIRSVNIFKKAGATRDNMRQLATTGKVPLVRAEIKMVWMGMSVKEPPKPEPPAPAPAEGGAQ